MAQRPDTGRWAGLWEFPHAAILPGESAARAAARFLDELSLKADLGNEIVVLKHTVTRFRITLSCMAGTYRGGHLKNKLHIKSQWLTLESSARLPVSSPQRRLVEVLIAASK